MKKIEDKIHSLIDAKLIIEEWKQYDKKIVFTNGCFDIFHYGHLHLLNHSKQLGDKLVIGLNDDSSIKKLKGIKRPIHNQHQRSFMLSSISFVDLIILFSQQTPMKIIKAIKPDVLTKGADYSIDKVVGQKEVIRLGGRVTLIPLIKNLSSSSLIKDI